VKRYLLLGVAAVAVLTGCGSGSSTGAAGGTAVSLKDKIVGTWKMDVSTMNDDAGVPPEVKSNPQYAKMKEEAIKKMGEARIEFKADGTVTAAGMGDDKPGKWSLNGNEIVLVDDKGKATSATKATINADGTKIHLGPSDPKEAAKPGGKGVDLIRA
jgi:hypothetical protein